MDGKPTSFHGMTIKELIARWRGRRLTRARHIAFEDAYPVNKDGNAIPQGKRKPVTYIPPGLYFHWFKSGNPYAVSPLIKKLACSGDMRIFRKGAAHIRNGDWYYDLDACGAEALREAGAASLYVLREDVERVEESLEDRRSQWAEEYREGIITVEQYLKHIKEGTDSRLDAAPKEERSAAENSLFQNEPPHPKNTKIPKITPPPSQKGKKTLDACEQAYQKLKHTRPENIVKRLLEQGYVDCTICKTLWKHTGKDKDIFLKKWEVGKLFSNAERTKSACRKHVDRLLKMAEPHTEEN